MKRILIPIAVACMLLSSCAKNDDNVFTPVWDTNTQSQDGQGNTSSDSGSDSNGSNNGGTNTQNAPKDHYGKPKRMPDMPSKVDGLPEVQGKLPLWRSDGRWLVDAGGKHINVHGFWQTHSPYFNNYKWGNDYNYQNAYQWNANQIDEILACGWQMDYMRLHMDTYWMMRRDRPYPLKGEPYEYFDEKLFKEALDNLYVPIIEHCISKGLHVLIHPGFVGPEAIEMGDGLHRVLAKVWDMISSHPKLANNTDVMFELLNEPVHIIDANGAKGSGGDSFEKALTEYMQNLIDHIRVNSQKNMLWVPGLSWQQHYTGYTKYKINDHNFGFAIHCYPGWYGSDAVEATAEYGQGTFGGGYESFRKGWDSEITPVSKIAPVMITEMDWAPKEYDLSWGKSITGEAGGVGFGANFKYLADRTENCNYIFFTAPEHLAIYDWSLAPIVPTKRNNHDEHHFLYDPEACNNQLFGWYQCYRNGTMYPADDVQEIKIGGVSGNTITLDGKMFAIVNVIDSKKVVYPLQKDFTITSGDASVLKVAADGQTLVPGKTGTCKLTIAACGKTREYDVVVKQFEFDWANLDPNIWEKGSWDSETRTLVTGQYGFGGWKFSKPLDLSGYSKVVCVLGSDTDVSSQASFRLFDGGYWDGAVETKGVSASNKNDNGDYELVINISSGMKKGNGNAFDPSSVGIIGIWSMGGKAIVIKDIYFE